MDMEDHAGSRWVSRGGPALTRTTSIACAMLVAIGLATTAVASPSTAHAATVPSSVVCSTYDASTSTATLRLQSRNPGNSIETVPIGTSNFFYPDLDDRGQPAQFIPGLQSWDFTVGASGQQLYWGLNGEYLNLTPFLDPVTLPFGRPCPERGPQITAVDPPALRAGVADQRVTIFGQGLAGSTATVSGAGVTADAIADTSDQRLDVIVDVDPGASTDPRDLLITDPQNRQTGCRHCVALDAPAAEQGPAGPAGPEGPRGPVGPTGSDASPTVIRATGVPARFRSGKASATAACPAGRSVVSGGYDVAGARGLSVVSNRPPDASSWQVIVRAGLATANARLRVYATCL
jgi:hypothetical protein